MESEIQRLGGDILKHPRYLQLLQFQHHGAENSVYDHSIAVAQAAYAIARRMRLSGGRNRLCNPRGVAARFLRLRLARRAFPPLPAPVFRPAACDAHARVCTRPYRGRPREAYVRPDRARMRGNRAAHVPARGHAAHADRMDRDAGGQSRCFQRDGRCAWRLYIPCLPQAVCYN